MNDGKMRMLTPRRMIIAAAFVTCVFVFIASLALEIADGHIRVRFKHHPAPEPAVDSSGLEALAGSNEEENIEVSRFRPVPSNRDYHVLTSKRNTLGFYNIVNTKKTEKEMFNPTLLELPRGAPHDFLVVARAFHEQEEIDGRHYKRARQIAVFANMTYNRFGRPVLMASEWSRFLVDDFNGPEHHCKNDPNMDKYIGPEDMKLFWTRRGAPLLIFTNQTPDENLCEGMFIIDARAAVPELNEALAPYSASMPEIRFQGPTPLRRQAPPGHEADARYQREKNWAPFQSPLNEDDNELFFMVEPGQMFKWKELYEPVEPVEAEQSSAVEKPFPPGSDPADTFQSEARTCIHDVMQADGHVHQSTPMLSMTLCNRGTCTPDIHNTILLGMVQRRYDPPNGWPYTWYDHRIATYNATSPYKFHSVSRRMTYHGEEDRKYIWTGSMVYYANSTTIPHDRSHGYLDDEIWLSFGIRDGSPGWMDVNARDLVADHYYCEGSSTMYRNITGFL